MNDKKVYVHYGSTIFDKSLFDEIENEPWVKPLGGLWGSPEDSPRSWKRFVENEYDDRIGDLKRGFKFVLKDDANVIHLYSVNDLDNLPKIDNNGRMNVWLDFEKLVKNGYDAIELHLSEEKKHDILAEGYLDFTNSLYYKLYGWDCDSILIMNPDIVIQIE